MQEILSPGAAGATAARPSFDLKPPPGRVGSSLLKPPPGRPDLLSPEPPSFKPSGNAAAAPSPPPAPAPPQRPKIVAGPPPPPPPALPGAKKGSGGPPPPPKIGPGPPRPPPPLGARAARPLVIPKRPKASETVGAADSQGDTDAPKAKLKPFFWDKVQANSDQSMVWNQLKAGSFQ